MNAYLPEGEYLKTTENHHYISSVTGLEKALEKQKILESCATLCDNGLRLHVDLGSMRGIIPREEAQFSLDNSPVKDIAILTRVGKPVCFQVTGFAREGGETVAMLSRRTAQKECYRYFISSLLPGDILPASVTHMESFGAFVDVGCGIISLLPIDCISVSRIAHPSERFSLGQRISVAIKNVDTAGRIFTTHRELLGTWEENASLFSPGQTVAGTVRSIEKYGIFVELTPNLAGLAECKPHIEAGQSAAVFIKSILPDRMKIKLILIDSTVSREKPGELRYFYRPAKGAAAPTHIDRWLYSPAACERRIETDFSLESNAFSYENI